METEYRLTKLKNPHFYDPIMFADYHIDACQPVDEVMKQNFTMPTESEIEQWSITESELENCANEFFIMIVVGDTVTVKRNKPFEFYSSYLRAVAPRLSQLLYKQQSISSGDELIKVIERYIELLDGDEIVEFSHYYTNRVFADNPNEVDLIVAGLWKRAFDVMMTAMNDAKSYYEKCITDEEECRLLGEGIAMLRYEVSQLTKSIQAGTQEHPAEKIESILKDIQPFWKSAMLEDNELKLFVLHDCWYELKALYRSTLQEKDFTKFDDDFYYAYMGQLFSMSSYVTQNGETLSSGLPVDRVLRVTEREIKLGRLPEDFPFRQNALKAKAEGKTDLFWSAVEENRQSNPIVKVLDVVSRLKKVRSVLRVFGI